MDKQYNNRIRRAWRRPESGNTHRFTQNDTKKNISNWKTPGHDGIHGFQFKKFTSFHDRLALEMNRCLQRAYIPEWMTKGRTTLIQKDPSKGTTPNNYRPITCLPMMWKMLIAQIREEIYNSLRSRGLFPEAQKGCRKGSRGTLNFKRETESLLMTTQNNAIRTNHIKARIDKMQQNSKCSLCGDRDKTNNYIHNK